MKKLLAKLDRNTLVALAVKQNELVDEIRGYKSGMTKEMLGVFTDKELIDLFVKTEKAFGLNTAKALLG